MSAFETYDKTSRHYDKTRVPVGAEIILDCLGRHEKPLGELTVLDAGCGTGAYSRAIIAHVGRIEAVDLSNGMLEVARAKLAIESQAGRIRFHNAPITGLPFEAETIDGVMINQVTHHLGDTAQDGFTVLRQAVAEFARVLRPGGVLVFNTTSREQLDHGYWYYALIPEARDSFQARFAPLEDLRAMFEDAGFVNRDSFAPLDAICQGEAYFDGRGPLEVTWRNGDSIWALAGEAELARALDKVRALDAAGELGAFVAEHDARRAGVGQITFLYATRA